MNKNITLTENKFNKYNSLFIKYSLNMYSDPKYIAKLARIITKMDNIELKLSKQKVKLESIIFKQKNHRPKSKK